METLRETGIGLAIWLARRRKGRIAANGETFDVIHAKDNARRLMRQRYCGKATGKGNKAWKRWAQMERDFRASGGFYLEDIIRGAI